jgi:hypothetical protein
LSLIPPIFGQLATIRWGRKGAKVCNLYSITTNQAAIYRAFSG